ncbi:MAG: 16S rRNA (cytidine(1402)-2'-O)-methyltransferase [Deltaproteobacteria bacterium]|nr:16S rRNA (cytidine(1402)-2'-O)-methyltransferase [Deltaproteobacteria bacterium]
MEVSPGTLFIIATPIGNLEDITFRAVNMLKEADLIAAEDTRRTRILLNAYSISASLTSYHDHNKERQGKRLLKKLLSGKSIALVSDAGTPGISDPGYYLVNLAIQNDIIVTPVPGVSAIITALSVSGLPSDRFSFEGFLPKKVNLRRKYIHKLINEERTIILYESPHRIMATLQDFLEICGERWIVVARELTKVYEEIVRGPLSGVLKKLNEKKRKGEFTILVSSARYSKKLLSSGKK